MSAIIAGKKCKGCGEEFWTSLGHPKWYDDVVKRGQPKGEEYLLFERWRQAGMCEQCFFEKLEKEEGCG